VGTCISAIIPCCRIDHCALVVCFYCFGFKVFFILPWHHCSFFSLSVLDIVLYNMLLNFWCCCLLITHTWKMHLRQPSEHRSPALSIFIVHTLSYCWVKSSNAVFQFTKYSTLQSIASKAPHCPSLPAWGHIDNGRPFLSSIFISHYCNIKKKIMSQSINHCPS
jgi:hypothetical protein